MVTQEYHMQFVDAVMREYPPEGSIDRVKGYYYSYLAIAEGCMIEDIKKSLIIGGIPQEGIERIIKNLFEKEFLREEILENK